MYSKTVTTTITSADMGIEANQFLGNAPDRHMQLNGENISRIEGNDPNARQFSVSSDESLLSAILHNDWVITNIHDPDAYGENDHFKVSGTLHMVGTSEQKIIHPTITHVRRDGSADTTQELEVDPRAVIKVIDGKAVLYAKFSDGGHPHVTEFTFKFDVGQGRYVFTFNNLEVGRPNDGHDDLHLVSHHDNGGGTGN